MSAGTAPVLTTSDVFVQVPLPVYVKAVEVSPLETTIESKAGPSG